MSNMSNTGWKKEEMEEGFIEQEQPSVKKPTPDMSRKPQFAGQTIYHHGYAYTYDDLGYCVKRVKIDQD